MECRFRPDQPVFRQDNDNQSCGRHVGVWPLVVIDCNVAFPGPFWDLAMQPLLASLNTEGHSHALV